MRRILVSAYGCEPGKGSEQGVGWHWVMEMAKTEELWVITRTNNRQGIENALSSAIAERIHFIYYDLPESLKRFKRKEKGLYLYYALWQWGAFKRARQLASEIDFDYCMHLTFGSLWLPTFMYKLPIPFIWGPVGGGESIPFSYIKALPWKGRIPQYARCLLIRCAALNPFVVWPARAATAIIARTDESKKVFPQEYQNKVRVMLETGMSREVLQQYETTTTEEESPVIRTIYSGRMVALKNVEMAVRALAAVRYTHHHVYLTIIGDGPLREPLTELVRKLELHDHIRFVGATSQQEAILSLQQSHIFLFPSLKEGGTWSLMEAMAVGLPVICMDTTGMHMITDDTCAIRIPPTTPEETIAKMAEAIARLVDSAELRRAMGKCGRKRIEEHFLWSRKSEFMAQLLHELDDQPAPNAQ